MRYTAVFEFKEGEEPAVGKKDGWMGGELCAVLFSDGLEELQAIKEAAEAVIFQNAHMGDDTWYHLAELLGWEVGAGDTAVQGDMLLPANVGIEPPERSARMTG